MLGHKKSGRSRGGAVSRAEGIPLKSSSLRTCLAHDFCPWQSSSIRKAIIVGLHESFDLSEPLGEVTVARPNKQARLEALGLSENQKLQLKWPYIWGDMVLQIRFQLEWIESHQANF